MSNNNVTFTREALEAMGDKKLKRMAYNELGIVGLAKLNKADTIDAILDIFGEDGENGNGGATISKAEAPAAKAPAAKAPMTGVEFGATSTLTKPDGAFGHRTTTTIHVSCGASSGNFPVAGKQVSEVGEFLREVLNVDRLSTGLVNGKEVKPDYVLKEGDNLEFLKPAGKKG